MEDIRLSPEQNNAFGDSPPVVDRTRRFRDARSMEDFRAIQFAYPQVPDWTTVPVPTLCQLVENYQDEPSCATSALTELAIRGHPGVAAYCRSILDSPDADPWLRACALSHLKNTDVTAALQVIARDALSCSPYLFAEMVSLLAWDLPPSFPSESREAVLAVRERRRRADVSPGDFSSRQNWLEFTDAWDEMNQRQPAR